MNKMEYEVVIAEYTSHDFDALVPLHLTAFKGYMNASLGRKYVRHFFAWFLGSPQTITLKAEIYGRICGYVVGAPVGYDRELNRDLFYIGLKGILSHPSVLLHQNFTKAAKTKLILLLGRRAIS